MKRFIRLVLIALNCAVLQGQAEKQYVWPEVSEQQLKEEVFGLRLRTARAVGGDKAGEKFLRRAFGKNPTTEAQAYMAWACLFSDGWGTPSLKDPARGKELAQAAIAGGSVLAMDVYGRAQVHGLVPDADLKEGITWLQRAAEAGEPRAIGRLGFLRTRGAGVPQDVFGGLQMTIRAAELGVPDDLAMVAYDYEMKANDDPTELRKAFRLYDIAVRHGSEDARQRLQYWADKQNPHAQVVLLTALVRAANEARWMMPNKARSSVKELEAIAGANLSALVELGVAYHDGYFAKRDYSKALALFQKAAALMHQDGQFHLAQMRLLGHGTAREPSALEDIRKLAEAGNVRAASYYAWLHYWGSSEAPGLKKDEQVAFRFVRQAAEKGDALSLANLGFCYLHGIGTPENNALAAKAFWQAYQRGFREGLDRTKRLLGFLPE